MFWHKKASPKVKIEKFDSFLMVNLYVNNIREARIQCVIESKNAILIGDIIHDNERKINRGYGSAMMESLISYAEQNGYSKFYGNLSDVDIGHKDRLYHFYEKFGFIITEYPEKKGCYFGLIEKTI